MFIQLFMNEHKWLNLHQYLLCRNGDTWNVDAASEAFFPGKTSNRLESEEEEAD